MRSTRRVRGLLGYRGAELLALVASAGFYAAFIVRSSFEYGGRTYYTLIDDSMISMVYARNLADGHGLVWQHGQYVEGYTNLLWTLWMAVLQLLPFSEAAAGLPVMITGAAILLATMLVVRSICRMLAPEQRFVPVAAMLLVGLAYPLLFWTLRGMETGLSALLLALAVRIALEFRTGVTRRRVVALATVLVGAVLTRDDLVIAAVLITAFAAWSAPSGESRRIVAIAGGAVAVAFGAHIAFRLAYYGDALPNTYYLKVAGIPVGTRVHRGAVALTYTTLTSLYVAVALAVVAILSAWRTAKFAPLAFLGALVAVGGAYSVYVGGDYAEQLQFANRFVVTVLPLLMVLAAVGAGALLSRAGTAQTRRAGVGIGVAIVAAAAVLQGHGWAALSRLEITGGIPYSGVRVLIAVAAAALLVCLAIDLAPRWRRLPAILTAALLVLAFGSLDYAPVQHWRHSGADDVVLERFEVARATLLRQYSPPSASAAVVVAGDWAYFSHRRGIDLLGKADSVIAHGPQHTEIAFKPGHTKWNYAYSIGKLRPDVVVDLVFPTGRDLCNMEAWGYRQVSSRFWVRSGARGIDVAPLAAGLSKLDSRPPFAVPAGCGPHA